MKSLWTMLQMLLYKHTHTHTQEEHIPFHFAPVIPPVCPSAEERCQLCWLEASVYPVSAHSLHLRVCLLSVPLIKADNCAKKKKNLLL